MLISMAESKKIILPKVVQEPEVKTPSQMQLEQESKEKTPTKMLLDQ